MADDRTTKILDTALWRFALQGVSATKTAEIAALAGVGVGTLFRTFPTVEALLQATYEHAIEQLLAPLQAGEGEAKRGYVPASAPQPLVAAQRAGCPGLSPGL